MWGLAPWGAGWLRATDRCGDFWTELSLLRCSESRINKLIVNVKVYINNNFINILPAILSMSETPSPQHIFFCFRYCLNLANIYSGIALLRKQTLIYIFARQKSPRSEGQKGDRPIIGCSLSVQAEY